MSYNGNITTSIINGHSISALGSSMTFGNTTTNDFTINGNAKFTKIQLNGKDLEERLNTIEERLGIIHRNILLESKYSKLKELGEEYKNLEKELLEQEKVWEILKK